MEKQDLFSSQGRRSAPNYRHIVYLGNPRDGQDKMRGKMVCNSECSIIMVVRGRPQGILPYDSSGFVPAATFLGAIAAIS